MKEQLEKKLAELHEEAKTIDLLSCRVIPFTKELKETILKLEHENSKN
jgi:hypothetical protein